MTREELIKITGSEEAADVAIDALLACVKPAFVQNAMKLYGKRIEELTSLMLNENYRYKGGDDYDVYKCVGYNGTNPILQNIFTCWTFEAHDLIRYDDNTIEWGYSTDGHFQER